MPDPSHIKVCLLGQDCRCPTITLFLAPEPLIPGGSILHLLEQAPLSADSGPSPDADLIDRVQAESADAERTALLHTEFRAFTAGRAEPARVGTILHDHQISATAPVGLDLDDPAELARLALLPEHPIGFRRTEDFREAAMRRAMVTIYRHFAVDQRIRLMYHGFADPGTGWFALRTASA
ncbi:hypothetical protein F5X71_07990 [Nocardia brasiliensis]|uniref:Uncharacterized protein n=1 Tax=Nocardia brasiliensis TaxID=37326 RepID=A0A6G9XN02_NOCBR|nr:hypothetical protein [Nocardia brasiliensis]QIS02268.1 hypothetical protein F5X71_07990 [Nocardia brasiliensis]